MADLIQRLSQENIASALQGFYALSKPASGALESAQLIELLKALPALSIEEHVDPILTQIEKHHRGTALSRQDHALLAYIDDSVTQILGQTDLDYKIEAFIRNLTPYIAVIALSQGVKSIFEPQPILKLMDTLIVEGLGWSEDLGVLGAQFMDKIELMLRAMVTNRMTLEECEVNLAVLFSKEKPIFKKMEQRLLDVEMKVLSNQKERTLAADLLNQRMEGKPLPLFIIFVLQGNWYEFLQTVVRECGPKSPQWQQAAELTEAIIQSVQTPTNIEQHRALMDSVPAQIEDFCRSVAFDTSAVDDCRADLISEHDAIRSGSPSDACDFDLINVDQTNAIVGQSLDTVALTDIEQMTPGQWYLYDDKRDPDEKVARIKLILNWQETMRLIFTNHNRRKVMHMNYAEFALNLSEGTIKNLNPHSNTWDVIKQHLVTVVEGVQAQKQRETALAAEIEKKMVTREYIARRKGEIILALKQHRRTAKLKQKRALILREKAQQKVTIATAAIESLRIDAWLNLPVMEGTLTPCKLVAVIPATENYIFANRKGLKVGEFTKGQLIHMLIAENSQILDTGAEFETVLSLVVSSLRDDKNKSFDELTRANA
ncbi:MAG: hypothetical protein ACI81O_002586 [Cyclobacteriaceae bacterium]|jgi:hypothetical protein